MKAKRQAKILELIQNNQIETQEELSSYLLQEGYEVTQATVSRDIRELKLSKVSLDNGKQKYTVLSEGKDQMSEKFVRVFQEGFLSMDLAQNILVIKTVSGMANAVCAAVDALSVKEIVGSIAGDDTILCVARTTEDAAAAMKYLRKLVDK
jgi:transcriptional regulator of arginine metabolism